MSDLLNKKAVDMTVGDQLKVGLALTAATVAIPVILMSTATIVKKAAEKLNKNDVTPEEK